MAAKMQTTATPGIFKRGNRYVVVWRHKGRQHKSFHRTLAEAREAKGSRQAGERKPDSKQTFEDYAREWLEGYSGRTNRGFSQSSRKAYERSLETYALPFFARERLADIDAPAVRRFVKSLERRGLAPASVKKNLVPVKAMFATALEDGALRLDPTAKVKVNNREGEHEAPERAKAMTRAELERLLGELPEQWTLFFELLAHTGLRVSEALGLDWSDVEFGAKPRLRVRRQYYRGELKGLKTRRSRRDLPLAPTMARKLWAARPARAEGPMFATRNGTRYADRNIRRVLDRAAERAGVPWVGFHSFRHTNASLLFDGGKNIRKVSAWLGHADPAFTLRTYVHLMDEGVGDADFLDDAVKGGNAGATHSPQTGANDERAERSERAVRQLPEHPQTAASARATW